MDKRDFLKRISDRICYFKTKLCETSNKDRSDAFALKTELMDFQSEFRENHPAFQSVEDSWNLLKNKTNELMEKHIPSKLSSTKHSNPWSTQEVRRIIRKNKTKQNKTKQQKNKQTKQRL